MTWHFQFHFVHGCIPHWKYEYGARSESHFACFFHCYVTWSTLTTGIVASQYPCNIGGFKSIQTNLATIKHNFLQWIWKMYYNQVSQRPRRRQIIYVNTPLNQCLKSITISFANEKQSPIESQVSSRKWRDMWRLWEYRKISNIRRTKSQNLNDSRLVLPLSLLTPLKTCVHERIKM